MATSALAWQNHSWGVLLLGYRTDSRTPLNLLSIEIGPLVLVSSSQSKLSS